MLRCAVEGERRKSNNLQVPELEVLGQNAPLSGVDLAL